MSYKIVDEILSENLFDPFDKLVMLSLARHSSDKTRAAWPSVATISTEASLNRRTVQRHLRRLESLGVIRDVTAKYRFYENPNQQRIRQAKFGGVGNPTVYEIESKEVVREILWKDFRARKDLVFPQSGKPSIEELRHQDALNSGTETHFKCVTESRKSVTESTKERLRAARICH